MSLNGIGSYSAYSNLFSGMYSSGGAAKKNTAADLQALMKKADEVRSPEYGKKIREQLKSGTADSEIGTVSSEMKLSNAAKELRKNAGGLNSMTLAEIKDKDVLVKKVNAFAESYNSAIDAMSKSDSVDALRAGVSMKNTVGTYSGALSRIGIKIGSDNKLTVNEEALRAADDGAVSSMMRSSYSPVARVADKAEAIDKAAANKAQTTAFKDMMYGSSAGNKSLYSGYSSFAGSFLGTLFDSYM